MNPCRGSQTEVSRCAQTIPGEDWSIEWWCSGLACDLPSKHFSNMVKAHGGGMLWYLHSFCSQDCNGTLTQSTPCPPFLGGNLLGSPATFVPYASSRQQWNPQFFNKTKAARMPCGLPVGGDRLKNHGFTGWQVEFVRSFLKQEDWQKICWSALLEDWTTWSDCSVSCGIGAITRFVIRCVVCFFRMCLLNTSWFELNVFGRMCYCYVVRKMIVQHSL